MWFLIAFYYEIEFLKGSLECTFDLNELLNCKIVNLKLKKLEMVQTLYIILWFLFRFKIMNRNCRWMKEIDLEAFIWGMVNLV